MAEQDSTHGSGWFGTKTDEDIKKETEARQKAMQDLKNRTQQNPRSEKGKQIDQLMEDMMNQK